MRMTEKQLFNCYYCKHDLDIELCKKNTYSANTKRGKCLPCTRENNRIANKMRLAEARPHNYMGCDTCDEVFYKYARNTKNLLTNCPYCNSKEIVPYL